MSVLNLDDLKAHLNITNSTYDDELESMVEAAEAIIAKRVGPLEPTVVTTIVPSNGRSLVLPITPVVSLTSVVPTYGGQVVDVSTLAANTASGVVTVSTYAIGLVDVGNSYTVTYVAGRDECPPDLLLAVKEMARHLWKSQRGGSSRPSSAEQTPAPGYLIPNTVAELLEPHTQLGFA